MLSFSQLIFCLFTTLVCSAPPKRGKFPFPILDSNLILHDSSTPYYKFDGIDYDELPLKLKNEYYDCYGDHLRCIRNRNNFHVVCSFADWYGWGYYYSICMLELVNCRIRIRHGQGLYGTFYSNDKALYQGDDYNCAKSINPKETG